MENSLLKQILQELQTLNQKADKFIAYMKFNNALCKNINQNEEETYNDWFKSERANEAFKKYMEQNEINKKSDK